MPRVTKAQLTEENEALKRDNLRLEKRIKALEAARDTARDRLHKKARSAVTALAIELTGVIQGDLQNDGWQRHEKEEKG